MKIFVEKIGSVHILMKFQLININQFTFKSEKVSFLN